MAGPVQTPARPARAVGPATLVAMLLAVAAAPGGAAEPVALVRVAPGVHVYVGPHGEAGPGNLGAFANAGVIVGERSVAIVDTGGSRRFGERLRAAVAQLTDRPISHVINTHVHPDHVLGNAAFSGPELRIVGHHKLPRALAQRAPFYLDNFARLVGPAFDGTRAVPPDLLVEDTRVIDLGDRRLRLTAHRTAHTDNDLSVLDERTGILFAGDLVFMERLPVVDGSLKGWLSVLAAMRGDRAAGIVRVVPGHGPPIAPWPDALAAQERYLQALLADTRAAVARGAGIKAAIATVASGERDRWLLFEDNHPRNVTASYTELEWE